MVKPKLRTPSSSSGSEEDPPAAEKGVEPTEGVTVERTVGDGEGEEDGGDKDVEPSSGGCEGEEESGEEEEDGTEKALEPTGGEEYDGKEKDVEETDSDDETVVLLPDKMYIKPKFNKKSMKLATNCYVTKAVNNLEEVLDANKIEWFHNHPQFRHFFHMTREVNHKTMGFYLLIIKTTKIVKKKEVWFIVNGVPIRYSMNEHGVPIRYSVFQTRKYG